MRWRAYMMLTAAVSLTGPVYALEPNRTLTQYVHRIWQTQQGLPDASVYSILQTRDGYLWLGTQSGMIRFDGVRFRRFEDIYKKAPSDIWIRSVVQDPQGALWIGTNDSGLYRFAGGEVTHYSAENGLPSDMIQDVVADGDTIWVCTASGLVRFEHGAMKVFRRADGLSSDLVRGAAVAPDGKLWIGGESTRLTVWDGTKFTSHALASMPPDAGVRSMAFAQDGTLWIGTSEGLVEYKNGHDRLYTTRDGLVDDWILSLFAGRDGSLWIGTRAGFSRLRKDELVSFRPEEGLSQSNVYSIFEDREGSLWVGTKHGLNQFLDGHAVPYTENEGLPSNNTGPLLEDRGNNIWVGTLGSGLSRFDGHKFTVLTSRDGLPSNFVYALAEGAAGSLWVGTNLGLARLEQGRVVRTYRRGDGLPSSQVLSLLRDHAGNLWVGTGGGAVEFRNGAFVRPSGLAVTAPVLALGQDGAGRIYLATLNAVISYAHGKSEEVLQNGFSLRGADAFYRDRTGAIWIGMTGAGLRLIENGKIYAFGMRDGLFDNEIYGLAADGEDRLWMACSKGIFWVPEADLRSYAAGHLRKITSTPYSPTDALRVIECKSGVQLPVTVTHDDRVWFSTIRGLIVLDPRHLTRNGPPPPVVIDDVTVNGEREQPARIGKLAPGRKNVEITYAGLSYLVPTRITFKYILEGYDRDWINAGTRREAYYTNLPPGKFRFRVSACSMDGACNETGATVSFVLASHYYQRVWFWPLMAVLIGLGIWAAYQFRIRTLREQFNLILTERNRIARELHDTLIQGLSGITMEMQALAGRMKSREERGMLEDIIGDAGTCLRETRRSVAGLRSGRSNLAAAIEQAARQITETKDVRLKLNLKNKPTGLAPDVEYNLVRIAQEAVTNSVKHSGARTVEVALDYTPKVLRLSVHDDGSGFPENGHSKNGHYGLIGMKERASHIGAELELATAPGRGTTISVVLPNGQNHS
ncbi:MAG TPA: two-component regulator propeller domain-containing protein [Bryobacteraceae bacterium]|nr:two-component regulator propeller domain-containing protein [Bryobacteraceae bacterium]